VVKAAGFLHFVVVKLLQALGQFCGDLVFPRRCALCSRWSQDPICDRCREDFRPLSSPLWTFAEGSELSWIVTPFAYAGRVGHAVRRLKFHRVTTLIEPLAVLTAREIESRGLLDHTDIVIPVPIHPRRHGERGFNQAELLAEGLPSELVQSQIVRSRYTPPLYAQDRNERANLLRGAFEAQSTVEGKRVLLLDDIYTTGATLKECARCLRDEGALDVAGFALTGA
jgi:ComF family protein